MLTPCAFALMAEVRVVDGAPTFAFVQAKFTVEVSFGHTAVTSLMGVLRYTDRAARPCTMRPRHSQRAQTIFEDWCAGGRAIRPFIESRCTCGMADCGHSPRCL